jgi:hypothetical protein
MIITSLLDQHCETRQREEGLARDNSKYRVSDAGKCRLMRYWKRQGKEYDPGDVPPIVRRTMQAGILLHEWIEHVFAQSIGKELAAFEAEGELQDEHRLGHFDLLMTLKDDSTLLADVKTVKDKQFYWKKKKGADMAHIHQVCSYADMLPELPDRAVICYLNRDNMELLELSVDLDGFLPVVSMDWENLIYCWDRQEEPNPNPESWECRYCIYKNDCPHV